MKYCVSFLCEMEVLTIALKPGKEYVREICTRTRILKLKALYVLPKCNSFSYAIDARKFSYLLAMVKDDGTLLAFDVELDKWSTFEHYEPKEELVLYEREGLPSPISTITCFQRGNDVEWLSAKDDGRPMYKYLEIVLVCECHEV